ncbi:MAG: NAD-dependent DNA ligase LigA [Spirochaetota bacterium]
MADRVNELEQLIVRHQQLYYNGEPEISDAEFDLLWDELRRLDPSNALLERVGADSADGYPKRRHVIPMGSQDKAADPEAFLRWAQRVGHGEYIVQLKMDGASIELQYEAGSFRCGVTRGDGAVGDDITPNVRRMRGLVESLPDGFTGAVRGEVLLNRELHLEKYGDKANPRNAANGLMKRKDGVGAGDLEIVCYDAWESTRDDFFVREEDKLLWLAGNGFRVVPYAKFDDPEAIVEYRTRVADERASMPFDIDGLVVKGQEIDPDDMRRARPERQIAFKFELEEAASTLREVIWNPSGSLYTPIGVIDPVRLAGTTVRRANLVNPRLIREMDLRLGSRVAVTKRGEIIPKIERVLENPPDAPHIELPRACERCGSELVDEGTRLYCPNQACPKRSYFRIRKWLDVLDVRDFGDAILTKLFESGRVTEIADLYTLEVEDLTAHERMGATLAKKILRNLSVARTVPLSRFVAGFNIEGVGTLIMDKAVAAGYDTLEKLREANAEQLAEVPGIGEVTARTIVDGLSDLRHRMDAVLATGRVAIAEPAGGPFRGLSFCFTGSLATMTRSAAQGRVRDAGGTVTSTITKGLSYLVTNDPESGSSKNRKARKLGIPIIDEEQFLAMLAHGPLAHGPLERDSVEEESR